MSSGQLASTRSSSPSSNSKASFPKKRRKSKRTVWEAAAAAARGGRQRLASRGGGGTQRPRAGRRSPESAAPVLLERAEGARAERIGGIFPCALAWTPADSASTLKHRREKNRGRDKWAAVWESSSAFFSRKKAVKKRLQTSSAAARVVCRVR